MKTILLLLVLCGLIYATVTTTITFYVVAVRHPDVITYDINGVPTDTTADVRPFRVCFDSDERVAAVVFLKSKGVPCYDILLKSFSINKTIADLDSTTFSYFPMGYTSLYDTTGCGNVGVVE